jgi:drug/metabolite transporter (DMT)-like permease
MEADPLAIAAWRTLGAGIALSPALWAGLPALGARDLAAVGCAGAALGFHFWAWFASLGETTVLRSTVLVCTVPAWTALFEWLRHGRRPTVGHWIGLLTALPGLALLTGTGGRATLAGDALAIGASGLWAAYFLIGRDVRQRVDAGTAMSLVCAAAAGVLFPIAAATGTPLVGFPEGTWLRIGLAILGPQLLGHLGFVYAVRWLPASIVSAIALLEPVGATVLAAAILGEVPDTSAIIGGLVVLIGVAIATR